MSSAADGISETESQIEDLKRKLQRAEKQLAEAKRRLLFDRAVHDAQHEGLVASLSKVKETLWG